MRFGLYAGGFLGPFGGAILAVLIPQLERRFRRRHVGVGLGDHGLPRPFAALQLVSGTIGEHIGIRAPCGTPTSPTPRCPCRRVRAVDRGLHRRGALQGAPNAFLTPLLLAARGRSSCWTRSVAPSACSAPCRRRACASPLIGGLAGEIRGGPPSSRPRRGARARRRRSAAPAAREADPPRPRSALTPQRRLAQRRRLPRLPRRSSACELPRRAAGGRRLRARLDRARRAGDELRATPTRSPAAGRAT